jgi:hypothetical protein
MGDRVAGTGTSAAPRTLRRARRYRSPGCVGFRSPSTRLRRRPEPSRARSATPFSVAERGVLEGAPQGRSRSATRGRWKSRRICGERDTVGRAEREGFGDDGAGRPLEAEREGFGDEREGLDTPREGFVRPGDVVVVGDNHGRARERRRVFHGSSREGAWRDLGADG